MTFQSGTAWGFATDVADDWRTRAKCRDVDPELFFPVGKKSPAVAQAEQARQVCRRCPVLADCEKWVTEYPQEFGVFAAMSPFERRRLVRPGSTPGGSTGMCRNGHRMTAENTRVTEGVRQCRRCYNARRDRYLTNRTVRNAS